MNKQTLIVVFVILMAILIGLYYFSSNADSYIDLDSDNDSYIDLDSDGEGDVPDDAYTVPDDTTDDTPDEPILDEPVFCTQDAKMCPDGSYVGRTGPNCEFICPGQ